MIIHVYLLIVPYVCVTVLLYVLLYICVDVDLINHIQKKTKTNNQQAKLATKT